MPNKNQDYIVQIVDMTHEGAGIAKIDGFTVFVDGAITGEKVQIKIVKVLKNFAYGKLIKIMAMSPKRKPATCENYKKCGGCSLQHLTYPATLEFKQNVVKNNLKKYAKLDVDVLPTLGLKEPYSYRNKAQFPIGKVNNEVVVGFFAERSHNIIPITDCTIQSKIANKIVREVKEFVRDNKVSTYDEINNTGFMRHIMIRTAEKTSEVMLVLVTNGEKFELKDEFVKFITEKNPIIKSVIQNINTKKTNVILGEKNILLYGKNTITDYIGKFKFNISAQSFFQVNSKQTEVLYKTALDFAELTGNETVFDLYCGIGTISLFLAQKAQKVYGVEIVQQAVEDAKRNAKENGVNNAEFLYGKSEVVAPKLYQKGIKADVVVLDPPRSGCQKGLIDMLNEMKPGKIVYVSCNPATLARDIELFEGYEVKKVQPVDMFPWTYHVETVIMMQNSRKR